MACCTPAWAEVEEGAIAPPQPNPSSRMPTSHPSAEGARARSPSPGSPCARHVKLHRAGSLVRIRRRTGGARSLPVDSSITALYASVLPAFVMIDTAASNATR
mmetsp:Transcript_19241/g.47276  ORF Transcript_19241/g.47276 Transcript_19241/m.47276 type:complete len:103 (+) Transcript_19241:624-932(+)